MTLDFEFIVIGSGPSGAMAAQTLVEAGKQVAMVDVGFIGRDYESNLPNLPFETLRHTDQNQHHYFLGDSFEAVDWNDIRVGAQLTPARKHLIHEVQKWIPMRSETFFPMESLAYGGLGSGWGLGAYVYLESELKRTGLNPAAMAAAYHTVNQRIGIAAGKDDISPYILGSLNETQPPLQADNSTQKLLAAYTRQKHHLNRRGIFMGGPSMAMLTQPMANRQATPYTDMDFYTDKGETAYRPWITINTLKQKENFAYLGGLLALNFTEDENGITLTVLELATQTKHHLHCKKMLLAAGALGSARIAMRSFQNEIKRLPILCNSYAYVPCVNLHMLGSPLSQAKTSMAQAFMIYDETGDAQNLVSVAIYTYRSLLLYRLMKEIPLGFGDGLRVMRSLQSAIMIAGVHHPDEPSEQKYLQLMQDPQTPTGDVLFANYQLNPQEEKDIKRREKAIWRALLQIGCIPLKRVHPGFGGSIHYAGTLPFHEMGGPGTTDPSGRLNNTRNVFIADSSGYNFLPAKGITFTIMAHAHVVALQAMKDYPQQ